MKLIRIKKWCRKGFEEIRRSPEVQTLVTEQTRRIASKLSAADYGWSTMQGKSRFRGIVFTDTWKARRDEKKHNTLLKALGS